MKKLFALLLSAVMVLSMAACSSEPKVDENVDENGNQIVEELNIAFVPSKDAADILAAAEPLKTILKDELLERGFNVSTINIEVGNNYEVVGEGLAAGSIDLGFIPAGNS